MLEIFGIKRAEVGNNAKMFGMGKHCAEKRQERVGEPFAKGRSDRKGLMSFSESSVAAQAEGFVQIDTEHCVSRFKIAQRV